MLPATAVVVSLVLFVSSVGFSRSVCRNVRPKNETKRNGADRTGYRPLKRQLPTGRWRRSRGRSTRRARRVSRTSLPSEGTPPRVSKDVPIFDVDDVARYIAAAVAAVVS